MEHLYTIKTKLNRANSSFIIHYKEDISKSSIAQVICLIKLNLILGYNFL